jgi:hypothetical protein
MGSTMSGTPTCHKICGVSPTRPLDAFLHSYVLPSRKLGGALVFTMEISYPLPWH